MATSAQTYEPYTPAARPLTPAEMAQVVTGSGWPRIESGTPTSEMNGRFLPWSIRGHSRDPGIVDRILRGEPIAATGDMKQRRYVSGLDWRTVEPEDATPEETAQTDHIAACLDSLPHGGLSGLIRRVMSRESYGFSLHELVYAIDPGNGLWRLVHALPIMTWSVDRWTFDGAGLVTGFATCPGPQNPAKWIPMAKVLASVRDDMVRNPEGTPGLRSLIYHCESKRDLLAADNASMERAGRGTLVITETIDASADPKEREAVDAAAANWQSGAQAWIHFPPGYTHAWDHGGDIPDPTSRLEATNQAIAKVYDDDLSSLGQNKYGARAVGSEMRISTQRQLTGVCEELAADLTAQIVVPLYRLNGWDTRRMCTLSSSGFYDESKLALLQQFSTGPDPMIVLTDTDRKMLRRMLGLR